MKRAIETIIERLKDVVTVVEPFELNLVEGPEYYHTFNDKIVAEYGVNSTYRSKVLEAFIEKRLFTLRQTDTTLLFNGGAGVYLHNPGYFILSCLCIVTRERRDTVEFIWTDRIARFNGFATALLKLLKIKHVVRIINHPFFEKRKIRAIRWFKPDLKKITGLKADKGKSSLLFDEMYNSSEEEPQNDVGEYVAHKMWLLTQALEGVTDIARCHVGITLYLLYTRLVFKSIGGEFESAIYGVMSQQRVDRQKAKQTILYSVQSRIDGDCAIYGQFSEDLDQHIVRNKVMMLSRYYDYQDSDEEGYDEDEVEAAYQVFRPFLADPAFRMGGTQIMLNGTAYHYVEEDVVRREEFKKIKALAETHNLYFHHATFDKGSFIVVMDTGINHKAAIEYATNRANDKRDLWEWP